MSRDDDALEAADAGIELRVGELILDGMPDLARGPFERAFIHELGRLLGRDAGTAASLAAAKFRRPLELPVASGATSGEVGQGLARVLHGALTRS